MRLADSLRVYSDSSRSPTIDNAELARQRAKEIKNYLVRKGIQTVCLTAKGGGVFTNRQNATPEGRARNRHAEIEIVAVRGTDVMVAP